MPEHRDRRGPLSIALRAVALLLVVAFVGFFLIFARRTVPPALAEPAAAPSAPQAPIPAVAPSTQQDTPQATIGEECRDCHGLVVESFAFNAHGKAGKFLKDSRTMACDTCHGDAANHIASGGKANTIKNPAKLTATEVNQSCLVCHSNDRHMFSWRGGEHDRKDMSCLSCHSSHHPGLLKNMSTAFAGRAEADIAQLVSARLPEKMLVSGNVEETCLRCHSDMRKSFLQRSTHLFRTELRNVKVGCASCHNPHGGEGDKMLVAPTVNNLCYSCHAEKRGPFLWEHPPARENCMVCHTPHGSNNPKLLTARSHMLCQQCHIHMLPRHSTRAGMPLDIFSFNRGCVNCHSNIHGSNHPGGRTFGR